MTNIFDIVEKSAKLYSEKIAIISNGKSITYKSFKEECEKTADLLYRRGIKNSSRILIILPNSIDLVKVLFAISKLGGVFVIINTSTTQRSLDYIIKDCKPQFIITNNNIRGKVNPGKEVINIEEINYTNFNSRVLSNNQIESTDTACLIYTSGSTSKPKGIICTHKNIIFTSQAIQKRLCINSKDIIGNILPFSFDYGLYQVFLSFLSGAKLVISDSDSIPSTFIEFQESKITILPLIPSVALSLIKLKKAHRIELSHLRYVTNTGERLPHRYIKDFNALFNCKVFVMYGLTECKRVSILEPSEYKERRESVGRPIDGVKCYIIDGKGNRLPPNAVGELVVEGPNVMQGYWDSDQLTKESFKISGHGEMNTLYTGDICSIDEEGYIYFKYRRNDGIYKQNGYRVSSIEVEEVALSIEGVNQALLIPNLINENAALFVGSALLNEWEITNYLKQKLEHYKIPKHVVVLEGNLPINQNGKTDRKLLINYYLINKQTI